jgi:small subunit ribosomal protein S13
MVYLFRRYIDENKEVHKVLQEIYGLNINRIQLILRMLGIRMKIRFIELSREQLKGLELIGKSIYNIDRKMKREDEINLTTKMKGASYKGLRLKQGLPSRGQRTHTNASTSRRIKRGNKNYNKVL